MSGTSADGIDAVVAEIRDGPVGLKASVVAHIRQPFTRALRARILDISLHGTVAQICELNFLLGHHFANAALRAIRQAGLTASQVTAIGSHGQTIHHLPNARPAATLQIGEPAVIAERTGITTIADFRVRDMAAGGQGAPLVPYADWVLFTDRSRPRIIQNIGGIGNLTFLPPSASLRDVLAFDTGPGNMVIDGVVNALSHGRQTFDRNGRWAARGKVRESWVREMLRHPYFRRSPPKTTGREQFGQSFVEQLLRDARRLRLSPEDIVASVTALTATSISDSYRRFVLPKLAGQQADNLQVVLGGGGAKNPLLRSMLRELLGERQVLTHEDFGIANEAKEALAFAILAHETLLGRPSNVPSATGANRSVLLGKIVPASKFAITPPFQNGKVHTAPVFHV
jgi:anhydro-N-acetylmuramic acid kinase